MKQLIIFFCFLATIYSFSQEKEKQTLFYSMISLIANPENHNDEKVSVGGFLKFIEGEEIRLFFSRDDLYYDNMKNCFVLYLDKDKLKDIDLSHYDGHYVSIIGRFNNIKHYYYGGAIKDVTYIESRDDIMIELKAMEIEEREKKK